MFVEREEPVVGYVIQRFGAVTLAMTTRVHCFAEFDEAEIEQPGPRRLRVVPPPRNVILGSHEAERGASTF